METEDLFVIFALIIILYIFSREISRIPSAMINPLHQYSKPLVPPPDSVQYAKTVLMDNGLTPTPTGLNGSNITGENSFPIGSGIMD